MSEPTIAPVEYDTKAFCAQRCKERHAGREKVCEEVCKSCRLGLEDDENAFTTCMGLKGFMDEDLDEEIADDIETEQTLPPPPEPGPEGEP